MIEDAFDTVEVLVESHQVGILPIPVRSADSKNVDGFKQVGLTLRIGTQDKIATLAELYRCICEVSKVLKMDSSDAQVVAPQTYSCSASLSGITRHTYDSPSASAAGLRIEAPIAEPSSNLISSPSAPLRTSST